MNANILAVDTGLEINFCNVEKYKDMFDELQEIPKSFANPKPTSCEKKQIGKKLKNAPDRCMYYTADMVAEMLGCSMSQAYKVIKDLNAELCKKGYFTKSGRVAKKYFHEKYYGY